MRGMQGWKWRQIAEWKGEGNSRWDSAEGKGKKRWIGWMLRALGRMGRPLGEACGGEGGRE